MLSFRIRFSGEESACVARTCPEHSRALARVCLTTNHVAADTLCRQAGRARLPPNVGLHISRRWLEISKRSTPAATATLIESQPPRIGIRTIKSEASMSWSDRPRLSLPIRRTAGHRQRRALSSSKPPGDEPTMATPKAFAQAMNSRVEHRTSFCENNDPMLARTVAGSGKGGSPAGKIPFLELPKHLRREGRARCDV
jgi:hypothetical protein